MGDFNGLPVFRAVVIVGWHVNELLLNSRYRLVNFRNLSAGYNLLLVVMPVIVIIIMTMPMIVV